MLVLRGLRAERRIHTLIKPTKYELTVRPGDPYA